MNPVFSTTLSQGRFETWAHEPPFPCLYPHQVHGTNIVSPQMLPCEADGLYIGEGSVQIPLAIKTADCLPILIEGKKGVVFLHAGWRGLAQGILKHNTIEEIIPHRAYIGPSIQECCFEVSGDFKEHFPWSSHFKNKNNSLFFNLQKEASSQLIEKFPELEIGKSPDCTCCSEKFHSYRKNKTNLRNWNLYIINGSKDQNYE